jgi:acyl-CoA reductase-like NAD-dependent aldehyde dehydrogenase
MFGFHVGYKYEAIPEEAMTRKAKAKSGGRKQAVRGDKMSVGDVSGQAIVVQGRNAKVTVHQGIQGTELAPLFDRVYQTIESLPNATTDEKQEIAENAKRIETEVAEKGEQANQTSLQRWMENIQKMAPDIVDVILASLGGPLSAATVILKKVAEHSRQAGTA